MGSRNMMDDIFCKIIHKEIPADIVMEEEEWIAFKDILPEAPVHILVAPKKHVTSLSEAEAEDKELLGLLMLAVEKVAKKTGLVTGYRVIINNGKNGGQVVPHLHLHLLGGKPLGSKMVR